MTYSDKLKDPRWQQKRLHIMERDNFTCVACGNREQTLHVHHTKYAKFPWMAQDQDLWTVCETCHERIEKCKALVSNPSDGLDARCTISFGKMLTRDYGIDVVKLLGLMWNVEKFRAAVISTLALMDQSWERGIQQRPIIDELKANP